jgi:hypothetical protein
MRPVMLLALLLTLTGVSQVVQSFQLPSIIHQQRTTRQPHPMRRQLDSSYRRKYSNIMMISPDQFHDIFISASMQHGSDISNHISSHAPLVPEISMRGATEITQWIADATTAASDTTKDDGGWWKAYINIFKSILTFVHSTVDGPLRSVGIEQTWGVSIFLFTASEYTNTFRY